MDIKLDPFEEVLSAYQSGEIIILVDDKDRENEGDFCLGSEFVTGEKLQFMATHGRGLICITVNAQTAARLDLPAQTQNNNSPFHTPFTVSIDHRSVVGDATGALPKARAATMKAILDEASTPADFVSPGSVYPLVAHPAGVLGRQGQTEGSYDLSRLAGLLPSGIICEILETDGTMMRGQNLAAFAKSHGLLVTSVAEVIRARVRGEILVRQVASSAVETAYGVFQATVFQDDVSNKEHLALIYGDISKQKSVLTRIHSECLTGDVFGSLRCDCGDQLAESCQRIVAEGCGVILYLRQEGRGIGLTNKLRAYALQDEGLDTVEANVKLGFAVDERDFQVAARILKDLKIEAVRLLTNNPEKLDVLAEHGIMIQERVPLIISSNNFSAGYLDVKKSKLGHLY